MGKPINHRTFKARLWSKMVEILCEGGVGLRTVASLPRWQ